jgi:hypothetical protein
MLETAGPSLHRQDVPSTGVVGGLIRKSSEDLQLGAEVLVGVRLVKALWRARNDTPAVYHGTTSSTCHRVLTPEPLASNVLST